MVVEGIGMNVVVFQLFSETFAEAPVDLTELMAGFLEQGEHV